MRLFFGLAAAFAMGCTPSSTHPPPDAQDAYPGPLPSSADVGAACTNLGVLGCPEGAEDAGCVGAINRAASLQDVDFSCIAHAATTDAVRLCSQGFVRCAK